MDTILVHLTIENIIHSHSQLYFDIGFILSVLEISSKSIWIGAVNSYPAELYNTFRLLLEAFFANIYSNQILIIVLFM